MIYWLAFKELFVCVVLAIMLGMMVGFVIMRGETRDTANADTYEIAPIPEASALIFVQKSLPKDTQ